MYTKTIIHRVAKLANSQVQHILFTYSIVVYKIVDYVLCRFLISPGGRGGGQRGNYALSEIGIASARNDIIGPMTVIPGQNNIE